ncbi:MAG: hypothetical protein QME05_00730 [Candidatus Margulisbacteria bacterium]|nr:hypothetical protein [Candidatus Margulisiibacteriota bacterium]
MLKKRVLPKEFKKYFWDVDFAKLSPRRYPKFVLERLLKFGDSKAVKWMFKHFSKKTLKDCVLGARGLDKRSHALWRLFFGLPPVKNVKGVRWVE